MKTTNYLLQTTNLPNKSQKPTNYQLSTKLINFKTHQIQQILFLLLSSICHSVIDFSTGCCMLYALRHLYAKKTFACFLSIILHSTFCILFCCSVVRCLLLCGSVLCSTFWPCSAGCGRARSGLLGILVYVQQAYSLSRNKGMKHTSKVST